MNLVELFKKFMAWSSRSRSIYAKLAIWLLVAATGFVGVTATDAWAGKPGVLQLQSEKGAPASTWVVIATNHKCTAHPGVGTVINLYGNGGLSGTFNIQRHDGDCDGKGGVFRLERKFPPARTGVYEYQIEFDGNGRIVKCSMASATKDGRYAGWKNTKCNTPDKVDYWWRKRKTGESFLRQSVMVPSTQHLITTETPSSGSYYRYTLIVGVPKWIWPACEYPLCCRGSAESC